MIKPCNWWGVSISAAATLSIGCETHEISWWLKHHAEVNATHNAPEVKSEYLLYIKLASSWWKLNKKRQAACQKVADAPLAAAIEGESNG